MYSNINNHIAQILNAFPPNHASEYDWLIQNVNLSGTQAYQSRYRRYWRMNHAVKEPAWFRAYFAQLQNALTNPPSIASLVAALQAVPTHNNGRCSLQFSFVSKLIHMVAQNSAIYDSMVGAFYFYDDPQGGIDSRVRFWNFLNAEYARVSTNSLLQPAITRFRQHFGPVYFTDVKVIDSLIWGYVRWLSGGALVHGMVRYT